MRFSSLFALATITSTLLAIGCAAETSDGTGEDEGALSLKSASFVCKATAAFGEKKVPTLSFALTGLDGHTDDDLQWAGASIVDEADGELPMVATPDDSLLSFINDNYSVTFEGKNLRFFGDSDDLQYTTLVLYKDSGFKKGYVRVEDGGGGSGDHYSTVSCNVTDLAKAVKDAGADSASKDGGKDSGSKDAGPKDSGGK